MQLSLLPVTTAVRNMATFAQSVCTSLTNISAGSAAKALFDANACIASWMQWLILRVLQATRLATSVGGDVDSWVADFGMTRLAGDFATGNVTYSRYSTNQQIVIPVGATVMTTDRSQSFTVTQDSTNSLWNSGANGYIVPIGVSSATVPVVANTVGIVGNILQSSISIISSTVSMDLVTNSVPFTGGIEVEKDSALKLRFQLMIQSLASGVPIAIENAATSVQQGLDIQYVSNAPTVGLYTLYVDDGSGAAPDSLIAAIYSAVFAVTSSGVTPVVMRPVISNVSINVIVTIATGATLATVTANITNAISSYIDGLLIGQALPYLKLASIIYSSDPNITQLNSLTINGATADIPATSGHLVRVSSLTVS